MIVSVEGGQKEDLPLEHFFPQHNRFAIIWDCMGGKTFRCPPTVPFGIPGNAKTVGGGGG